MKRILHFLHRLSLTNKMRLLLFNIVSGLLALGIVTFMALVGMKDDFDTLFNNRTLSSVKLQEIKDIFSINIYDTMLDIEQGEITPQEGYEIIKLGQELIHDEWSEYKTKSFATSIHPLLSLIKEYIIINFNTNTLSKSILEEEESIKETEQRMVRVESILQQIFTQKEFSGQTRILMRNELYPAVNAVNIHITQLIHLQLESAIYEKEMTDKLYRLTLFFLIFVVLSVLIASMILAIVILDSIKGIHKTLEATVEEKTRELSLLNESLKMRIFQEVSENRKKDRIMYQQARLAAMGEMISNIAHQWRQPLNVLSLIIQSFQVKKMIGKLDDNFIDTQVNEGLKLAKKMSDTIDDFRNFFRPDKEQKPFLIAEAINESMSLVKSYFNEFKITIHAHYIENVIVYGFSNEFHQVIINLLNNSKDAFIERECEERHVSIVVKKRIKRDKEWAVIYYYDNAGGIPLDVKERIFEPYFTTKHQEVGTGIGLYMSQQIIQNHMNGDIVVRNISLTHHRRIMRGALFIVYLPIFKDNENGI